MKRFFAVLGYAFTGDLSLMELGRRTWKEIRRDQVTNKASELAFFFTLAFFPLLIFLITVLGFVPGAREMILGYLDTVLPREASGIVHQWVATVFRHRSHELLSVSLLFALWSASAGVNALIDVFNVAYEVHEGRPFWKYKLVALGLTAGLGLLVLGGALLFTGGADFLEWIDKTFQLGHSIAWLYRGANYGIGLLMLFFGISILHYYGPNVQQRWHFFTPGAFFSVAGILLVSYLFSLYLRFVPSYSAVYGGLGAVVVFMLWLYLISIILVVGAEINDEVKKASGQRPKERE